MRVSLLLAVVLIWALPPALALNCTLFSGEDHTLCSVVDALDLQEDAKNSLMRHDLYGSIQTSDNTVHLSLPDQDIPAITLEQIYDEKIAFGVKFGLFIFFNYIFFKYLTKSSNFQKWLTADY